MGKKEIKNKYGLQVGDIFNHRYANGCDYFQVIELRGETKIAVREIEQSCVAFDGYYECLVPIKKKWASASVHICEPMISTASDRKVMIDVSESFGLIKLSRPARLCREETYLACKKNEHFPFYFRDAYPEIAVQLDLRKGSGVYAKDKPFEWLDDDSIAIIRYPDGRENEIPFQDLMCSKKITKEVKEREAKFREVGKSVKMLTGDLDFPVEEVRHTNGKFGRYRVKLIKNQTDTRGGEHD